MARIRVLIAPSGFKEALGVEEVGAAIARGLRRASPEIEATVLPLVDGGEGFTRGIIALFQGRLHEAEVTGPLGEPVSCKWGSFGPPDDLIAVIEMAAAAGLSLVPAEKRNPLLTTTFGVGELIRCALDAGARTILIGCGDSGTNDGGAGMAQALGMRLTDARGEDIGHGGGALQSLERIDVSRRDPRIARTKIRAVCNPHNVLCGTTGVARVFGRQKGASDECIELLSRALDHYAEVIEAQLGRRVRDLPGSGASGGLGAGLVALLGAELVPRTELLDAFFDLDTRIAASDLVVTAEGGIDGRSALGKIPLEVGRRASRLGVPVVALVGSIGACSDFVYDHGISACFSIQRRPCTLGEAMAHTSQQLESCAENVMRAILAGARMHSFAGAARECHV
jgi:glycerate kinase